jgi:hypothetical protein
MSDLEHIRSALAFYSPRLRDLLGEVLDTAEQEHWRLPNSRSTQMQSSPGGTFRMRAALDDLDAAITREVSDVDVQVV